MAVAREADAVVIGAGALGLSVALHLAARGLKRVTALDQYQPGSQASCRAAGLFKLIQPDAVRTAISRSGIEEVLDFEQRFRVPLRVERSGSLMIARTS